MADFDHLLHLSLVDGHIQWRIECMAHGLEECQHPTLVEGTDPDLGPDEWDTGWVPVDPPECWLENQFHFWVEDMLFEEVFEDLSIDPLRSPVKVKFSCCLSSPDDSPLDIKWELVE